MVLTLPTLMQDTSLNLLFAGHDTSATAITLAVRHLKLQPHVLCKLREEQQQVGCSHEFHQMIKMTKFGVWPLVRVGARDEGLGSWSTGIRLCTALGWNRLRQSQQFSEL